MLMAVVTVFVVGVLVLSACDGVGVGADVDIGVDVNVTMDVEVCVVVALVLTFSLGVSFTFGTGVCLGVSCSWGAAGVGAVITVGMGCSLICETVNEGFRMLGIIGTLSVSGSTVEPVIICGIFG